ncbi:MAG: coenzyme F420-0:L-glutamate ligase [Propionibacteriaceae bacterium]|nr:coenzyme F420-0:L-glutamate ligase [Propionibacteriaceae bacterium]
MISIFAPTGIGEVGPDTDLAGEICAAVEADPAGPLLSGDIVVVTSKIISKAESRYRPAGEREAAINEESVRTVARRGPTKIVSTRHGLTLAAAGVDNSNVAMGSILLLPVDPDGSAARLRRELQSRCGAVVGVIISDTAGRAWRMGQTDQAIGAAGVRVIESYEGRHDSYGNELQVTAIAIADELAAAADLAKSKLANRPVAVIRGLSQHLSDDSSDTETGAAVLVREESQDLFRHGSREAVIAAVLTATGQGERYEEVVASDDATLVESVVAGSGRREAEGDLLRSILGSALSRLDR